MAFSPMNGSGEAAILDYDNAEDITIPSMNASTTLTYTPTKNGVLHMRGYHAGSSSRLFVESSNIEYNNYINAQWTTSDNILNKGETYTITLRDAMTSLTARFIPFRIN